MPEYMAPLYTNASFLALSLMDFLMETDQFKMKDENRNLIIMRLQFALEKKMYSNRKFETKEKNMREKSSTGNLSRNGGQEWIRPA